VTDTGLWWSRPPAVSFLPFCWAERHWLWKGEWTGFGTWTIPHSAAQFFLQSCGDSTGKEPVKNTPLNSSKD